jgi:glycine/D-amino acid oxidase-like deaminating enzyme
VMHSGVTLAPVAGRLVAEEVVHGIEAAELRGCRPE